MSERRIIFPTPEEIGYPAQNDPQKWAKFLVSKSNWDEAVAKQFRYSGQRLGTANRIEAIRGDDANIFSFQKFADVLPFDPQVSQNARDSLLFRLNWELSGQLPRFIKEALEMLQTQTMNIDWSSQEQIASIYETFEASREFIRSRINNTPRILETLAYRVARRPVLDKYWAEFERQSNS